jgi:hypothetical protein
MYLSYKYIIFKPNALVNRMREKLEVTMREDMEKAFPPMLSDFTFIVVVGFGLVERCLLSFKIARALAPYI